MEASDLKIDLIRKINHIIYQQSLIKRDEDDESKSKDVENIKSLQDLRDVDLSYLTMNDKQIINITLDQLIKFYNNDKVHNPKLLSENFFDNVRAQNLENEYNKDVREDGSINPDLENIIENAEEKVVRQYDANSDIESLIAKKTIQKTNQVLSDKGVDASIQLNTEDKDGKSLSISLGDKSLELSKKGDKSGITIGKSGESVSISMGKSTVPSDNISAASSMEEAINQLKLAHLKTIESLAGECESKNEAKIEKIQESREPLKCDSDEDTLKIKKEVVDEFGLFLNKLFDDEMSKISEWEDKELAEKFTNFYQSYNLKIVEHLIEKYNMEK